MSTQITLEQENTVIDQVGDVLYQVTFRVVASEGIPLALFTFFRATEEYSHPSTVYDLDAYPESLSEAVSQGLEFYRQPSVTRQFDDMTDAIHFGTVTRSRLQTLARTLPLAQEEFAGLETYVYTG